MLIGTYEGSGGPKRSNEVEEGLISNLMDMVETLQESCTGHRSSSAHYYMQRPQQKDNKSSWDQVEAEMKRKKNKSQVEHKGPRDCLGTSFDAITKTGLTVMGS